MSIFLHSFLHSFLIALILLLGVDSSNGACQHSCLDDGKCNSTSFGNTCYYAFLEEKRAWNDSKAFCETQNLTMAKLPKELIQSESSLKDLTNSSRSKYGMWLGGRTRALPQWTFIKGYHANDTSLNWENITATKILNLNQSLHQCGTVVESKDDLKVEAKECTSPYQFLCRLENADGSHHIYTRLTPANWYDARSWCRDQNAELFYPTKEDDMVDMKRVLASFKNIMFFIGLRHNIWEWEDGEEILHYNWDASEPNSFEMCLMMRKQTDKWGSARCDNKLHVLCQDEGANQTTAVTTSGTLTSATTNVDHRQNCTGPPDNVKHEKVTYMLVGMMILAVLVIVNLVAFIVYKQMKKEPTFGSVETIVRISKGNPGSSTLTRNLALGGGSTRAFVRSGLFEVEDAESANNLSDVDSNSSGGDREIIDNVDYESSNGIAIHVQDYDANRVANVNEYETFEF